jgi:hypothetical protein
MTHRSIAGSRTTKRVFSSLLVSAFLIVGSPVVATGSAASPGAHKSVSATHGDCKNDNAGKHNGYDCPSSSTGDNSGGDTGGGTVVSDPVIAS